MTYHTSVFVEGREPSRGWYLLPNCSLRSRRFNNLAKSVMKETLRCGEHYIKTQDLPPETNPQDFNLSILTIYLLTHSTSIPLSASHITFSSSSPELGRMARQVELTLRALKTSLVNLPPILVSQLSNQSIVSETPINRSSLIRVHHL